MKSPVLRIRIHMDPDIERPSIDPVSEPHEENPGGICKRPQK